MARMADSYFVDLELVQVLHIARVPRFVYREMLRQLGRWLRSLMCRDALASLIEELLLLEYVGFMVECRRPYQVRARHPERERQTEDTRPAESTAR
jgi:hypothetical protein